MSQTTKTAPLSFAQERLWYLDQLHKGVATYNRPANVRITGPLNYQAIQQSLEELVCRHESFRMRFSDRDLSVAIVPADDRPIELVDLSSQSDPHKAAAEWSRQEASRPFDLQASPPVRLRLLRLGAEEHLLLCTLHHIVFDGWSQSILISELAQLYEAQCQGGPNPLPSLKVQYTDIVLDQRQRLEEGHLNKHIEYWQQQLAGSAPALRLPTDYIRPAHASQQGSRHTFRLPDSLTQRLRELNKKHRVTLFMTLFAAFQALLYRYTGQTDITTGTPIAGRTHTDMEGLIGLFINTLPLRIDLTDNPTFAILMSRVRRAALEAYQHQEVPLQTIIEAVAKRPSGNLPLFETLFNLQPAIEPVRVEDVTFSDAGVKTETAKADLSMDLKYSSDAVFGELEYRSELFTSSTVQAMANQWVRILEQAVDNPSIRLDDLSFADGREVEQLTIAWNQTERAYPSDRGIHTLIEEQARRTPDKIAVVAGETQLSYSELDRRANQLANYLIQTANPDRVVLLAERSAEMIVGILSILKSGACYIPVDAATPADRIRFILDETKATLLTTHQELSCEISEINSTHICLERDKEVILRTPTSHPESTVGGNDLAYITFTSGSTGQPKGVMIEHHSVVNYARTVADELGVTQTDRVLQFASISFDASVEEIFGALTTGATLVLRDEHCINSIPQFLERIAQWEITFASLPTAFWHELAHHLRAESMSLPRCLETVVIGGQKASSVALRAWCDVAAGTVKLFNTYGPTETTVVTTIAEWTSPEEPSHQLPIGRPIPNSYAYVLDAHQRPVPVGMAGELYIAGRGVARGYLNRPQLTAESFMACPFGAHSDGRMYRTGDRVRWLRDGQLEFLDRVDNQIKIRGYRVEPQEITSNLENLPNVRQSLVVAQDDETEEIQLVAYVVPAASPAPTPDDLRSALSKQLPDYMIPGTFVFLDSFPLNRNGKIDEQSLPRPDGPLNQPRSNTSLQTETQRQLADIWREILGVSTIGLHDQFLELGGHSLKAMQMVTRLADRFGVDIPLRLIFEKQRLIELAEEIERCQQETSIESTRRITPSIVAISRERRREPA